MSLDKLNAEVALWRAEDSQRGTAEKSKDRGWVNEYGKMLYDLNVAYGAEKKQLLEEAKVRYTQEYNRLSRLHSLKELDRPKTKPGRSKRGDFSDAVKIAAHEALTEGVGRTKIRMALAIQDTKKLDRVLEEGKALAEQAEEEW